MLVNEEKLTPEEKIRLWGKIAYSYYELNDLDNALEYRQQELEGYAVNLKKSKDDIELANCYLSIGKIYQKKGNLEDAMKHYKKCLEIQQNFYKSPLDINLASTYMNMGIIYR